MRGTFLTTKYATRDDLNARRPSEVLTSTNSFVDVGLSLMWHILAGEVRNEEGGLSDHLGKGRLIVGNGDRPVDRSDERLAGPNTDYAELDDGYPQIVHTEAGYALILRATFAEDKANFEWLERGVTSVQGILIDRSVEDHGRKAPGTIWTLEAQLELGAA